jgi:hypothetical protein
MLRSDSSECKTDGFNANGYSETADTSLRLNAFATPPSASPLLSSVRNAKALPPSKLPAVLTDRTNTFGTPLISLKGGVDGSPSAIQPFPGTQYEQMFGKLPDPIRLHEQTGAFDGQVVFVGHPNRDISAHQWSSVSFQWINIGRYAYTRDKIEGSLASDRRKGSSDSHTPLQFFMLAANNREKLIMENGRSKEENVGTYQPTITETARMARSSEASSLTNHAIPNFPPESSPPELLFKGTTAPSRQTTVRRGYLEDPFIAPTKHVSLGIAPCLRLWKEDKGLKGSLDSSYEFPFESVPPRGPVAYCPDDAAIPDISQGQHSDLGETFFGDTNRDWNHLSRPALREVNFGEEAASSLAASRICDLVPSKCFYASSPENTGQQYRNESPVMEPQTKHSGIPPPDHLVIPNFAHLQPTARSLFPPPGLTVANPHRTISGQHIPAPPYAKTLEVTAISEPSGSEATIVDAAVVLRFSDPDGMKSTREYEIANGLSQQAPTLQSFKGPFFTDTKPTTSDPTALLSVHTSEEEKLVNWFRDGHRPARQQEYARTLISATTPSSRHRTIGVVGQGFDNHKRRHYENTPLFVRLYEGLSEYAEEYRNGGSERSYFTRAWKVALPQLRDLGPDGNNSYYSRCFTSPAKDAVNA